jgi:hypothetical protein
MVKVRRLFTQVLSSVNRNSPSHPPLSRVACVYSSPMAADHHGKVHPNGKEGDRASYSGPHVCSTVGRSSYLCLETIFPPGILRT